MGNKYYQQLLQADPTGFIDPFKDLGTYDSRLNKFKEPVSELLNPFSGRPYSKIWQKRIETMREIFISYIKSTADSEGSESRKKECGGERIIKYDCFNIPETRVSLFRHREKD